VQLTQYTDYGLRTLIALALQPDAWHTVSGVASGYGISRNHLVKVVARLARHGYVDTQRGKGGGMRLARPASAIRIGAVVRDLESELGVVECLSSHGGQCTIAPACALKGLLRAATRGFLEVLDQRTLDELVQPRQPLQRLLGVPVTVQQRAPT
jgi:Rrf2 family nitric oxide-sensitive transcriptional repressor